MVGLPPCFPHPLKGGVPHAEWGARSTGAQAFSIRISSSVRAARLLLSSTSACME